MSQNAPLSVTSLAMLKTETPNVSLVTMLEATDQPAVGAFVAGVGTGGTITGVGRFLKSKLPGVRIVLADPVGSRLAGLVRDGSLGPDGSYQVEGIGSSEPPSILASIRFIGGAPMNRATKVFAGSR